MNIENAIIMDKNSGSNFIELDNGKWLFNDFGKYRSGLCYVMDKKYDIFSLYIDVKPTMFNLPEGDLSIINGDYWKSKKGTNCFAPKIDGKHILIRDNWGGCFNDYRGGNLKKLDFLFYNRASSNGGGNGYDYVIMEKGTKLKMSIDDI